MRISKVWEAERAMMSPQKNRGGPKQNRNKGILRLYRSKKNQEAETRATRSWCGRKLLEQILQDH